MSRPELQVYMQTGYLRFYSEHRRTSTPFSIFLMRIPKCLIPGLHSNFMVFFFLRQAQEFKIWALLLKNHIAKWSNTVISKKNHPLLITQQCKQKYIHVL